MESLFELGYWGLFFASFLAATVLPFSSEAILVLMLSAGYQSLNCLIIATAGNWLGGMTGYYLGYLAKWEWLNKYFRIKKLTLEKVRIKLERHGSLIALFCWLPFIGDLLAVGLGMIRTNLFLTSSLMLVGKLLRYIFIIFITEKVAIFFE